MVYILDSKNFGITIWHEPRNHMGAEKTPTIATTACFLSALTHCLLPHLQSPLPSSQFHNNHKYFPPVTQRRSILIAPIYG